MPRQLPEGCPPHCMWGQVDHARKIADGWWSVSTPSHGGHIVSAARLSQMPDYMRRTTYSQGGQFEEDCDWCLPVIAFYQEFVQYVQAGNHHYPADYDPLESAWKTFERWLPEAHAQFIYDTNIVHMNMNGVTYDSAACAAAR